MSEYDADPQIIDFIFNDKIHKFFEVITGKKSIHSPTSLKYYKEVLGADKYVMTILEQGLKFPFRDLPVKYEEQNNRSARDNDRLLWDKITEWEAAQYIERVTVKPTCVNPLSVSEKFDLQTKKLKKRVCLDLSRHVNDYMLPTPVKLCNLTQSESLIDKGDYQAGMDLENQYFHVRIHSDHQTYLGCKVKNPDTLVEHYFQFNVMIYGCKPAAAIVTRLSYPIVKHLHGKGVKFSIYMDDGRTLADSYNLTLEHHLLVQSIFLKAGWNIQYKKTCTVPTQKLYHQGFICDSENMVYKLPEFKIDHLKEIIAEIVHSIEDTIKAKELARVIGKIIASEKALGPIVRIMLRSTMVSLDYAVLSRGWDTYVNLNDTIKTDLQFISDNMDEDNGQPIVNYKTGISLNDLLSS